MKTRLSVMATLSNRSVSNATLPLEMQFTLINVVVISIYANLLWISLLGNIVVLVSLARRKKKSRVHILLINLCVADTITTLVEMPLKIAWKVTVRWLADDVTCRCVSFLRVFGLYLSALLLVAISVDRFLAIWTPLASHRQGSRRVRCMIVLAWTISLACAAPQAVIWHVTFHPAFPWYYQCVTFGSFASPATELAYGVFLLVLTYGVPLVVILTCYMGIWWKMFSSSLQQEPAGAYPSRRNSTHSVTLSLRTNNSERFVKAKHKTLRMTVMIVGVFVLCWSPYQIMSMWYFIDRASAQRLNQLCQEILFIFGVFSSVVNPYIYGVWSMGLWRTVRLFKLVGLCVKDPFTPPTATADHTSTDTTASFHRCSVRAHRPLPARFSTLRCASWRASSRRRWAFGELSNSFSKSFEKINAVS